MKNDSALEEKLKDKIKKYRKITYEALNNIKIPENLSEENKKLANEFLDFAKRYFDDAKYFEEKGLLLESLASLSYAHAWLDAGVKAKLFKGKTF